MGMPAWGDEARMAIAYAKGGGGFKGSNIDPIPLSQFLAFVADEWEHVEPEEYCPSERPIDDPRNPEESDGTRWSNEQEAIELQRGGG